MRRRGQRPADLTSLFDVLFILVFVSLVNAAGQKKAAALASAATAPKPAPRPPPSDKLHREALSAVGQRPTLILRISREGVLTAIEGERKLAVDLPLLEHVPDPDVQVAYLGERSAELRLCRQAALHLGEPDLSRYLVIISPAVPLADLQVALVSGLEHDALRCLREQQGLAVVVEP